jgi:hypothetical protein
LIGHAAHSDDISSYVKRQFVNHLCFYSAMQTIGERCQQIIEENRAAGLNQSVWAERAKVPRSTISSIITGQSKDPGCEVVESLSRAAGVNFLWLATGRGPKSAGAARLDPAADEAAGLLASLSPRMQRLILAIVRKLAAEDEAVTAEFATRAAILGDKLDDVVAGDGVAFLTYLAESVAEMPRRARR